MLAVNALVVDDSRTSTIVLKNQLNEFDVVVESASDGGRALDLLRDHHPDVIFLDHVMPGLDGFQVLQRIRDNQATKNIPVVMYTSQAAPLYIKEAKSLGAIAVIPKNVTQEELADALDKAEIFRLTAANDDFANPCPPADAVSQPQPAACVSHLPGIDREQPGQSTQQREYSEPVAAVYPVNALVADPLDKDEQTAADIQASHTQTKGSHWHNRIVLVLLTLLMFVQGYDMLRNKQQQETISELQHQLLLQDQKIPEIRAQLAAEQQQLGENFSKQMEFLITILTHESPVGEVPESQGD